MKIMDVHRSVFVFLSVLFSTFNLLFFSVAGIANDLQSERGQAAQYYEAGHYREAFTVYERLLTQPGYGGEKAAVDLSAAVNCLHQLNAVKAFDDFIEAVIQQHDEDWRVLKAAAGAYRKVEKVGYLIAGKFVRGRQRGPAKYVQSDERDRVRALQLLTRALDLAATGQTRDILIDLAATLIQHREGRQAWKLQYLTDLAELPDFDQRQPVFYDFGDYSAHSGAPVDSSGEALYYAVAGNFESARNDGERWRFLLQTIAAFGSGDKSWSQWQWADFLWQQFGVQTISSEPWFRILSRETGGGEDTATTPESNIFVLHTLNDNETLARLANGIKRFALPEGHNFVLILQQLAKARDKPSRPYAEQAADRLATLYENRRQFETAANYWQRAIKRFGDEQHRRQTRVDQILGAWAKFEDTGMKAVGDTGQKVYLRYRNAGSVELNLYPLKTREYLEDIKTFLSADPESLQWGRIQLERIGFQVLEQGKQQYLGKRLKTWRQKLDPAAEHYDRRAEIALPDSIQGAYLLEARVAGGNTSYIVVWNNASVIVKKPMEQQVLYYLAEAGKGIPQTHRALHFFGYRQHWFKPQEHKKFGRNYKISTRELTLETDAQGLLYVDNQQLSSEYKWMVYTGPANGPGGDDFAFLGFNRIWYGGTPAAPDKRAKAYVISNQPVYRPGQTVKFQAWVRRADYGDGNDGKGGSRYANHSFNVEIHNPKGEKLFSEALKADEYGGVSAEVTLDKNADLGLYHVNITGIGGGGQFRVEEYKKPEFEVSVETPTEAGRLGDKFKATIKAEYYFGAPVANAKVKYRVMRYDHDSRWYPSATWDWLYGPGYWWFCEDTPRYPGWRDWGLRAPDKSGWPVVKNPPELVQENEVEIGTDGRVTVEIDTLSAKVMHGDSDHRYEITVQVVDQSRRVVRGTGEILVSRRPYRVYSWVDKGYYQTGDVVQAGFAARTIEGVPVTGTGEVKLFRIHYDSRNAAREKVTETLVQSWNLNPDQQGRARLQFKADKAGQYRLAYVVRDDRGEAIEGAYLFNIIGTAISAADSFRFNELELIADKKHYAPNQRLKLMINSNRRDASVLLLLRAVNGRYETAQTLALKGNTAIRDIAIENRDRPNFFIEAVTVFNGQVFTEVEEIAVPPQQRLLNVELLPQKTSYKPGEQAQMQVRLTDLAGKPFVGSTVISVYDEALDYIAAQERQNITAFFWKWRRSHNPNTQHSARRRFSNMTKPKAATLQPIGVFGDRLPEDDSGVVGGNQIEEMVVTDSIASVSVKANVKVGGFGGGNSTASPDESQPPATIRRDFADFAFWKTDVKTNRKGIASVNFAMPENLTRWKATVWAMGHGTKVGQAQVGLVTAKKLLLRMQLPRFAVAGDELVLSANIHNYLETDENVEARLELAGDTLQLLDRARRNITLAAGAETRVDWRVRALGEGDANVRMLALGRRESDAVEMPLPVNVHGMAKTDSFSGTLTARQSVGEIKFTLPEARREDQTSLELRYSPTLAGALMEALPYLTDYPYDCTEQTLSRFLPEAQLQNALLQAKVNSAIVPESLAERTASGLERLARMQLSDGGWGWFSGWGERSQPHMTAYVVHGLQQVLKLKSLKLKSLKQKGLKSPPSKNDVSEDTAVLDRGLAWLEYYQATQLQQLKNAAAQTRPYKTAADNTDAFVAMVLGDAGKPDSAMLDYLYRDRLKLSAYGKVMLALALHKAQRTEERDLVRRNVEQLLVMDDENETAYLELGNDGYWWHWYGSEFEAHAYYLKLLAQLEPKGKIAPRLVKYLLNNRRFSGHWHSTRDTAVVIEAVTEYLLGSGEVQSMPEVDVIVDAEKVKTVRFTKDNLFSPENHLVLTAEQLDSGEHTVKLVKRASAGDGSGPLYYNAYLHYFTEQDSIGKSGLEIKVERRYYKLEAIDAKSPVRGSRGQALEQKVEKFRRTPIDPKERLSSGDQVEVELILESKNDYEYVAIEDMKAAGFEPLGVRSGYNGNELGAYIEYRDDRVSLFVTHLGRGRHSVSYRMRAEIPGRFSALPTRLKAMYAPDIKANSDENTFSIED